VRLAILGIPTAVVTWTVTHEEVLREFQDWCGQRAKSRKPLYQRKFFYLLTCEYCLSHYISAIFLGITRFQILLSGWRGYLLAWLTTVWLANVYMSLYGRLRLDIRHEHLQIKTKEARTDGAAQGRNQPQAQEPATAGRQ